MAAELATLRAMDGVNGVDASDAGEDGAANKELLAKLAKLTNDERWFLSALDVAEDGTWEARHMSEDSERMAARLARRGLCHRSTFRNERGHLALQFERDSEVSRALIALDDAQAAKEQECAEEDDRDALNAARGELVATLHAAAVANAGLLHAKRREVAGDHLRVTFRADAARHEWHWLQDSWRATDAAIAEANSQMMWLQGRANRLAAELVELDVALATLR